MAQDPSVLYNGTPLFVNVDVPAEETMAGPRGYRVHVVDYDASTGKLYQKTDLTDLQYGQSTCQLFRGSTPDTKLEVTSDDVLGDPAFHAQNVYAIVMRILARFEFALGRRINWGFDGHQIFVAPHAFADANAFYSKPHRGLFFGYFTPPNAPTVFTCLSHDVVAHETTHALLDGLRERFTDPSSPQQPGLHEGLADIVALLSIFSLQQVVERCLDLAAKHSGSGGDSQLVSKAWLTKERLQKSVLLGLGEEVGTAVHQGSQVPGMKHRQHGGLRSEALRRSVLLTPDANILQQGQYAEAHNCGEVLVAAMMNAFLEIWCARINKLGGSGAARVDRSRAAEDGSSTAEHLLTMAIRAIDYTPTTDVSFCDYLSALLTADYELQPDDSRFSYRAIIRKNFAAFGIAPSSDPRGEGIWQPPNASLDYGFTHFESMQKDRDEVFRFLWENRKALGLNSDAYTRVMSIRPCTRVSSDGFVLRETVGEYVQMITLKAAEVSALEWEISPELSEQRKAQLSPFPLPQGMPPEKEITIYGGGTLIFDEYGRLKYHIRNKVLNADRQEHRLAYLWDSGFFDQKDGTALRFANFHRLRWTDDPVFRSSRQVCHDDCF